MKVLITGGAGFIGSAVVRHVIRETDLEVVNLDKLTYAGNLRVPAPACERPALRASCRPTSATRAAMRRVFAHHRPDAVMHFAAESHVDRSIDGPGAFVETNIVGTFALLEAARATTGARLRGRRRRDAFRFLHVSTDEVYGSLGADGLFTEETAYAPNSPYSATKAASDHLVRAWHHTYGLPVLITNCSNNYGPYQFPEKLIPLMILNALEGKPLPVYGDGDNVRDWLYVEDHCAGPAWRARARPRRARRTTSAATASGPTSRSWRRSARLLDELAPRTRRRPGSRVATDHLRRRPAGPRPPLRDRRRARSARELGWAAAATTFETGLGKTVRWYLDNRGLVAHGVVDGSYRLQRAAARP